MQDANKYKVGFLFPILVAIWTAFMLVVTVSLFIPAINQPAIMIICKDGKSTLDIQNYNPYPGESITTYTNYCETDAGKTDITWQIMGVGFLLYSVVLSLLAIIWTMVANTKRQDKPQPFDYQTVIKKHPDNVINQNTDVFKKM